MVQINFARREVNCKIVYYGPGLSGKTTNLEIVHRKAPPNSTGKMTSIATEGDRTLFFDFLPLDLGEVAGMRTKFQLYTVPGQVYYNSTRKLVLQGADGVVFVADSNPTKMTENLESLQNLVENMEAHGMILGEHPFVLQYNKRDLPNALSMEDMNAKLNKWGLQTYEAVAVKGEGVLGTLKGISKLVLERLNRDYAKAPSSPGPAAAATPAALAPAPPPPRQSGPPAFAPPPKPAAAPPRPAAAQQRPAGAPPRPAAPPQRPAAPPQRPAAASPPRQQAAQQRAATTPYRSAPPPPPPPIVAEKKSGCGGAILLAATTALAAAACGLIALL